MKINLGSKQIFATLLDIQGTISVGYSIKQYLVVPLLRTLCDTAAHQSYEGLGADHAPAPVSTDLEGGRERSGRNIGDWCQTEEG